MALDIKTDSISSQMLGTHTQHGSGITSNSPTKVETDSPESINSDVLQLTRMIKTRAETAAMRISASQNMQEISATQAGGGAIREIQTIMMRLTELSDQATNIQTNADVTSIQVEAQRLGQQISSILNTQGSGGQNIRQDSNGNPDAAQNSSQAKTTPGSVEDLFNTIQEIIDKPLNSLNFSDARQSAITEVNINKAIVQLDNFASNLVDRRADLELDNQDLTINSAFNNGSSSTSQAEQAQNTADAVYENVIQNPELASLAHSHLSPALVASLLK